MTLRKYLRLFMHYYVHHFNYHDYAHDFHWLSRNQLGETARNALQLDVQRFQVQCQAKESAGLCSSLLELTVCAVLKLLCKLFDYYAHFFGYYTHYLKTPNCYLGQYSLQKAAFLTRAEAEHHHSLSGTTKVILPVHDLFIHVLDDND